MFWTVFWSSLLAISCWAFVAHAIAAARLHSRVLWHRSLSAALMGVAFGLRVLFGLGSFGGNESERTAIIVDITSVVVFCIATMWDVIITNRAEYKNVIEANHLSGPRLLFFRH